MRNVSGRVWKTPGEKSKSKVSKGNGALLGWEKRQELRKKESIVKKLENEIEMEKVQKIKSEKEERLKRKLKKEENQKKAEIYVKVSDAKARRMKRKQLKALKKVGA